LQQVFSQFNFDVGDVTISFGVTGGADAYTLGNHVVLDSSAWQQLNLDFARGGKDAAPAVRTA
jgi:hypothetical protein